MAFLGEHTSLRRLPRCSNFSSRAYTLHRSVSFSPLAISIVDSLCLLQQYKWNTIKILAIRIKFHDHVILIVSSVAEKIGRCREVQFGRWEHGPVTVVERFKQQSMYGLSVLTKKVAVVERWPVTVVGR